MPRPEDFTQVAHRVTAQAHDDEIAQRRAEYEATFEAQERARRDPHLMALLWTRLAELSERYRDDRQLT